MNIFWIQCSQVSHKKHPLLTQIRKSAHHVQKCSYDMCRFWNTLIVSKNKSCPHVLLATWLTKTQTQISGWPRITDVFSHQQDNHQTCFMSLCPGHKPDLYQIISPTYWRATSQELTEWRVRKIYLLHYLLNVWADQPHSFQPWFEISWCSCLLILHPPSTKNNSFKKKLHLYICKTPSYLRIIT